MNELVGWIAAAQRKDRDAFAKLVRHFQDMAFGIAYARLGDFHLAEDAAQEAFLEAFRCIGDLEEVSGFPNWLRRVVLTQCDRMTRGKKVSTQRLIGAMELSSDEGMPEKIAVRHETTQEILSAVIFLPETQRLAVTLFYLGEKSEREVAEFLGVPVSTVKKRLFDARRSLKERLVELVEDKLKKAAPSKNTRFASTIQILQAAESGDTAAVQALLKSDPELVRSRASGRWGKKTPLHGAAEHGHVEICRLLLDHGAEVMARDDGDNATPLHWAAHGGHISAAQLLLQSGADINDRQDLHEAGPLGWAITLTQNNVEFAEFLAGMGAHLDIFAAIALRRDDEARRMIEADRGLLEAKQSKFENHRRPLHFAAAKNNVRAIDMLIELGAPVDHKDDQGLTAIDWALLNGQPEAFERLASKGMAPKPDLLAQFGSLECARQVASLMRAIQENDLAAVCAIVEPNASLVNIKASDAWQKAFTPLHLAAWNGCLDVAKLLVEKGADLNIRDGSYNAPPIGWANENDQRAVVELLLNAGSQLDVGLAAAFGALERLKRFVSDDPACINKTINYGTPLHQAILHGRIDVVRWLLENGADLEAKNRNGQTAMRLAELCAAGEEGPNGGTRPRHDHAEILELLNEYRR